MPNPMLTEDDLNPPPLFRVFYQGHIINFFSNYERADAYVHMGVLAGNDSGDYEIREQTKWEVY